MKKLILILSGALLVGSIAFAAPLINHQTPQTPAAKETPKQDPAAHRSNKTVKKIPMKKEVPAAKPAPAQPATK